MVNGTFFTKLKSKKALELPAEIINGLSLEEGDKIEVHIKKIKTRRMDIKISRNPLSKILDL
ncbi:MAG: hypothetical protein D8M58_18435 [Calditrichaeota bacterium]|nr:MAG: hypothetical protein DWQ03_11665 [Calditrichota bacterium]MBL1207389.1 hypothetical protein [Calditrichota bacterium]NOG47221.1 hypothetical protein [Calditrichota bacterium]